MTTEFFLTCAPKFQKASSNALRHMGGNVTFKLVLSTFSCLDGDNDSSPLVVVVVVVVLVFVVVLLVARNIIGRNVATLNICRTKLNTLGTGAAPFSMV
jgi:hypothetical protein